MMNDMETYTADKTPIEIVLGIDENGMTTARKLYDFLELSKGQFARWAKANILDNPFTEENVDYWGFDINVEGNITQDYKLTARFAKKLSMKGSGAKAEQAREYFTRVEDKLKEVIIDHKQLSPQLQLMNMLVENMSRQEIEQKRQGEKIAMLEENQKVIAQAVSKTTDANFKQWVGRCLSAIAESPNYLYIGSREERHRSIRTESYERLNQKRPCRLNQRVETEKGRALNAGASQARIKEITKLSIIESDKDLKPVYESVIREMMIAYCVEVA